MTMTTTTTAKRLLSLTAGLAFAAAALTGCTSPSTPTADSTSSGGTEQQERMRWESDRRACLSKQGFELPDEPGQIDFGSRQAEYDLAAEQCDAEIGPIPGAVTNLTPEQKAARAEAWAVEDKCYRDAGFSEGIGDTQEAVMVPEGASDELVDTCTATGEKAFERSLGR
jgi:hypothetical protein